MILGAPIWSWVLLIIVYFFFFAVIKSTEGLRTNSARFVAKKIRVFYNGSLSKEIKNLQGNK